MIDLPTLMIPLTGWSRLGCILLSQGIPRDQEPLSTIGFQATGPFGYRPLSGQHFHNLCLATQKLTLPETNMAPENTPLEKEVPIENHQF